MIAIGDLFGGGGAPVELSADVQTFLAREPFRTAVERTVKASYLVARSSEKVRIALGRSAHYDSRTGKALTSTYRLFLTTRMKLERSAKTIVHAADFAARQETTSTVTVMH
jgi:hypothetical protein